MDELQLINKSIDFKDGSINREQAVADIKKHTEYECKAFYEWCFFNEKKVTGYYSFNDKVNKLYELYLKSQEESQNNLKQK